MGLPENLDALLVKHDITQETVARIAGVTPGAVTGWRKGSRPRKDALLRLEKFFGLTEDDLLSDAHGLAAKEHGYYDPRKADCHPAAWWWRRAWPSPWSAGSTPGPSSPRRL